MTILTACLIALYLFVNIFHAGIYYQQSITENEEPSERWTWVILASLLYLSAISISLLVEKVIEVLTRLGYDKDN